MDFDGQFARTRSLAECATSVKQTDCHCNINDTFEQLAASWGKTARKADAKRKRTPEQPDED